MKLAEYMGLYKDYTQKTFGRDLLRVARTVGETPKFADKKLNLLDFSRKYHRTSTNIVPHMTS